MIYNALVITIWMGCLEHPMSIPSHGRFVASGFAHVEKKQFIHCLSRNLGDAHLYSRKPFLVWTEAYQVFDPVHHFLKLKPGKQFQHVCPVSQGKFLEDTLCSAESCESLSMMGVWTGGISPCRTTLIGKIIIKHAWPVDWVVSQCCFSDPFTSHPFQSQFLCSTSNFGQSNPLERCPIFRNEPITIASRKVEFPGGTANCIDTSTWVQVVLKISLPPCITLW